MPTHFQTHFQLIFHRPAVQADDANSFPTQFARLRICRRGAGPAAERAHSEHTNSKGDRGQPDTQGAPRSHTPPRTLRTQGQLGGPGGVCVCVGGGGGGQMLTAPCGHQRLEGTQQPTMMMGLMVALMVFIDGASGA